MAGCTMQVFAGWGRETSGHTPVMVCESRDGSAVGGDSTGLQHMNCLGRSTGRPRKENLVVSMPASPLGRLGMRLKLIGSSELEASVMRIDQLGLTELGPIEGMRV